MNKTTFALVLALTLSTSTLWAANVNEMIVEGQIIKSDGNPLESPAVTFSVKIMDPTANSCVLYEESNVINMLGSQGNFKFALGAGSRVDGGGHTFSQVFINAGSLTSLSCSAGTIYSPGISDDRQMIVSFNDGSGLQTLSSQAIKSVPFAQQAQNVTGYGIMNLAKISGVGSATVFTPNQYDFLNNLAAPAFSTSTPCLSGDVLKFAAGTWSCAADASGSGITSINGLNSPSQTFAFGTAGSSPNFNSVGTVHTLNMPTASSSGVTAGTISKTEYDTFNTKLSSSLPSANIFVGNAINTATSRNLSGDATLDNIGVLSLAPSGVVVGTYGNTNSIPQITVDAKGRVTGVSNVAVASDSSKLSLAGGTMTGNISATGSFGVSAGSGASQTLTLASPNFSGSILLQTGGTTQMKVMPGSSATEYITIFGGTGALGANAPTLGVNGAATNTDLNIKAKGTGKIILNQDVAALGFVGIGTSAPSAALDVVGHMANSTVGTPGLAGCGSAPTITGNDTRGKLTFGSGAPASCALTFASPYGSVPYCVLTPLGDVGSRFYMSSPTAGGFTVNLQTGMSGATFSYFCMQ